MPARRVKSCTSLWVCTPLTFSVLPDVLLGAVASKASAVSKETTALILRALCTCNWHAQLLCTAKPHVCNSSVSLEQWGGCICSAMPTLQGTLQASVDGSVPVHFFLLKMGASTLLALLCKSPAHVYLWLFDQVGSCCSKQCCFQHVDYRVKGISIGTEIPQLSKVPLLTCSLVFILYWTSCCGFLSPPT